MGAGASAEGGRGGGGGGVGGGGQITGVQELEERNGAVAHFAVTADGPRRLEANSKALWTHMVEHAVKTGVEEQKERDGGGHGSYLPDPSRGSRGGEGGSGKENTSPGGHRAIFGGGISDDKEVTILGRIER